MGDGCHKLCSHFGLAIGISQPVSKSYPGLADFRQEWQSKIATLRNVKMDHAGGGEVFPELKGLDY